MIHGLAPLSQTRIMTADAHHLPEMTDAMVHAMIVDIARAPATEKIESEIGAGLEIAATASETEGTEMGAEAGSGREAPAENEVMTDEVGASYDEIQSDGCSADPLRQGTHPKETNSAIAHVRDHWLEIVPTLGREPGHRHLEDTKVTDALIAKILVLERTGDRPMARWSPVVIRRKWMWTSRRMRTKMRWRK